jgi:hypothetical protein
MNKPELVERVVEAFDHVMPEWVPVAVRERYATASIEELGVERLVAALTEARMQVRKYGEFFCEDDFDPLMDRMDQALSSLSKGRG